MKQLSGVDDMQHGALVLENRPSRRRLCLQMYATDCINRASVLRKRGQNRIHRRRPFLVEPLALRQLLRRTPAAARAASRRADRGRRLAAAISGGRGCAELAKCDGRLMAPLRRITRIDLPFPSAQRIFQGGIGREKQVYREDPPSGGGFLRRTQRRVSHQC